jgi:deoxyribose-phosphate aldolase
MSIMSSTINGLHAFRPYEKSWDTISKRVNHILRKSDILKEEKPEILKDIIGLIDLTTLEGTDNSIVVGKLVETALETMGQKGYPHVPAVCVHPSQVRTAREKIGEAAIMLASVAGGFPSGQTFPEVKNLEVMHTAREGADEIDIVINRGLLLEGKYEMVYHEIKEMKMAAGDAKLKVILETCELPEVSHVREATILSILAGADFVKTSTGKGRDGAELPSFLVMADTIREHFLETGKRVGIKAAGGIRTPEDAMGFYVVVKEILKEDWLQPALFRIGASSLFKNILKVI